MNIYTEQAEQFLKDCNAKLEVKYDRHDYYFHDDTIPRDIYRCKLNRNGKQYSFNFGQSINGTNDGVEPTAYDVLSCLTRYELEGDVWDFAKEYGYTIDSSESFKCASKIYRAVCREWRGVNKIFGDVLDRLCGIN